MNNLVNFLTEERSKGDQAIKEILLSSHPAFAAIKKAAKIPYRVVFYTFDELDALLSARSFKFDPNPSNTESYEWDNKKAENGIRVWKRIFDDENRLKILTPSEWDSEWVSTYNLRSSSESKETDIPF